MSERASSALATPQQALSEARRGVHRHLPESPEAGDQTSDRGALLRVGASRARRSSGERSRVGARPPARTAPRGFRAARDRHVWCSRLRGGPRSRALRLGQAGPARRRSRARGSPGFPARPAKRCARAQVPRRSARDGWPRSVGRWPCTRRAWWASRRTPGPPGAHEVSRADRSPADGRRPLRAGSRPVHSIRWSTESSRASSWQARRSQPSPIIRSRTSGARLARARIRISAPCQGPNVPIQPTVGAAAPDAWRRSGRRSGPPPPRRRRWARTPRGPVRRPPQAPSRRRGRRRPR